MLRSASLVSSGMLDVVLLCHAFPSDSAVAFPLYAPLLRYVHLLPAGGAKLGNSHTCGVARQPVVESGCSNMERISLAIGSLGDL